MELMKGLQTIREMCKQTPMTCVGCTLDTMCPFYMTPHEWSDDDMKHIVAAAEDWKKKRRQKTMLEVLKERMPDANIEIICPSALFGCNVPRIGSELCCNNCEKCWNSPAPEMYQDKE